MSIKQFTGGTGGGAAISLTPNFVAIGPEYCEANGDGLNTGRRLVKQMDINPYSPTFQTERIFVVAEKSDVCPISNEPFYKPTGNKRCKRDDHNRYTGGTEQEERDVNPRSPGFNSSRWVDGSDDLRACPLPELPFLRVLGENSGAVNGFKISATIKDAAGQLFTVTCLYDGTGSPFADLYRDFGTYTLIGLHAEYFAGVAVNKFLSRIVMAGVMDQAYVQSDPVNTPANGSCIIDVAGSWEVVLNDNRAIRFVFSDRVAAGQFVATRTAAFSRNDCGPGKAGTPVNFTKTYTSFVSQADADNKKAADGLFDSDGQAFANNPVNGSICQVTACAAPTNVVIEDLGISQQAKPAGSFINIDTTLSGPQVWNAQLSLSLLFQGGKAYVAGFTGSFYTNNPTPTGDAQFAAGPLMNPELAALAPAGTVNLEIYRFIAGDDTVRVIFKMTPDGEIRLDFVNSSRKESGTHYGEGYHHQIDSDIDGNAAKIYLYDKDLGSQSMQSFRISYQGTGRHTLTLSGDTMFNYDLKETTSSPVIMMIKPDTNITGTITKVCSTPPDYSDLSTPVNFKP